MKDLRFDLFRLSLRERSQKDFFIDIEKLDRIDWIRKLFSTPAEFFHYGAKFVYIPLEVDIHDGYIRGKIGREVSEIEHTSPEDGYQEYIHDAWKAAAVIVDPAEHEDGQKVAIQFHPDVGKPVALSTRLVSALEERQELKHYLTSIHPITNSEAFWNFVKRNEGKITKIRFELEVPNMFGAEDEYEREMREFREKERAQKVVIEIKNPDGIDPHTDRVRFTADKAMSQGTGKVTAKAMGKGNKFSSDDQQVYSKIPLSDDGDTSAVSLSSEYAESILGHDEVRS